MALLRLPLKEHGLENKNTDCIRCKKYIGENPASGYCSPDCFKASKLELKNERTKNTEDASHVKKCFDCEVMIRQSRTRNRCKPCRKKQKKKSTLKRVKTIDFYNSTEWQKLRYSTLKKYARTCMVCFRKNLELHVDHIKPRSKFPELELEASNLQVLCKDCNFGKSNYDEIDWRPSNA